MAQEVPYITIKSKNHAKASNISNLVEQQKNLGFPVLKKPAVEEYITIPFPDFCTIYYEITIWTQFESQMNEILEKIFYNYDFQDSFVMWSEYDNATKKGNGYRFVGYRDGNVTPQNNIEQLSDQERVIKHTYTIKVPTYLILDPKDEALAYGRNKSTKRTDDNSKYVYKNQNAVSVQLKEELVSHEVIEALNKVELDLFAARQDTDKQNLFNLLSRVGGGSGGGGSSPTLDTATPQPIALVGLAGSSGRLNHSDHVHAHGNLPGGSLHDLVSALSAGFVPTLSGADGYGLIKTGSSASWGPVASSGGSTTIINGFTGSVSLVAGPNISIASSSNGSIAISGTVQNTQVTGSDNFFVNQVLTVSGSIVNPVGHLILTSSAGSNVVISGSLQVLDTSSIMTRGKVYNDSGDLILSSLPSPLTSSLVAVSGGLKSIIVGATGSAFLNGLNLTLTNGLTNTISARNHAIYFGGAAIAEFRGAGPSLFGTSLAAVDTAGNSASLLIQANGNVSLYFSSSNINTKTLVFSASRFDNNGIFSPNGHLILSGASGSFVTISGNLKVTDSISNAYLTDLGGFTSSFTASVQSIGDARYANLTTFNNFVSTTNTLTQSLNLFTASINAFTASFSASVQSISDIRYVLTGSAVTQRVNSLVASGTLVALGDGSNPSIIVSGSRTTVPLVISGSSSGSIVAVDSHLILSSSAGSRVFVSGAMSVKGSDLTVVGTSSPALAVSTGGGSTTAATFAGAGNAHGVTISGGSGGSVSALVVTALAGNPTGGVGITVTCNASTTTGGNGINTTGGNGSTFPGVGLAAQGGSPTTAGTGARGIISTGGNGAAGNAGGDGVKGIGGTGQGSGSAGVGVIGQGGVHGAASGSRQSGIGLSGSGNASGSGGWFVGGDKGGHAVVAYAGLSTDNGVGSAYVVSGAFASASLVATETHLILSSSAGSRVHVSGAMSLRTGVGVTAINSSEITFTSSAAALYTSYGITSALFGSYNTAHVYTSNNDVMAIRCGNTTFNTYAGGTWEWFTDVSADGITGAKVKLSASSKGNINLSAKVGHLILSSSVTGSIVAVSGNLKVTTHVIENATQAGTTVDTTAVVIDNFLTTDYRAMKYVITVSSGSSYQAQEMFVLHSGTSTTSTTYAQLSLPGNIFCGFTASITGSTLNIIASGSSPGNTVKFIRNAVVI